MVVNELELRIGFEFLFIYLENIYFPPGVLNFVLVLNNVLILVREFKEGVVLYSKGFDKLHLNLSINLVITQVD